MPWQATASRLINLRDPATGLRAHPFVVITIQRQAGKTSLVLAEVLDRCLFGGPRRRVWYTAQNGQYARDAWAEVVDELSGPGSPLAGRLRVRRQSGGEVALFPNGSTFRPFPPTRDALHSKQSDLVIVDEAWRHNAARGAELLQGIGPTQATRPGAQVIVVSTAGAYDTSTFLKPLVDRGRGGDPAIAYLEWSIPDGIDPFDLDAVVKYHPAIGWTIGREFIERERGILDDMPGEFARAYGNRWTQTLERVIDAAAWSKAATVQTMAPGRPAIAADIALDRSRSAILACHRGILEVVASRPGTDWIAAEMRAIVAAQSPAAVVVDRVGPSATLADDLEAAGVALFPLTSALYAAACARFEDDLTNGRIRYRLHPALDAAVDGAAKRPYGEGWAWGRRNAAAPIPELVAATLASWADQHRPADPVRPVADAG